MFFRISVQNFRIILCCGGLHQTGTFMICGRQKALRRSRKRKNISAYLFQRFAESPGTRKKVDFSPVMQKLCDHSRFVHIAEAFCAQQKERRFLLQLKAAFFCIVSALKFSFIAVRPSGSGTVFCCFEKFSCQLCLIDQEVEYDGKYNGAKAVQHGMLF